jgi:hypothetical protein
VGKVESERQIEEVVRESEWFMLLIKIVVL